MTELHWVKILADNWRGRNGNSTTGDSVRNSCANELEKVAAKNGIPAPAQEAGNCGVSEDDLARVLYEAANDGASFPWEKQCSAEQTTYKTLAEEALRKFSIRCIPSVASTDRGGK